MPKIIAVRFISEGTGQYIKCLIGTHLVSSGPRISAVIDMDERFSVFTAFAAIELYKRCNLSVTVRTVQRCIRVNFGIGTKGKGDYPTLKRMPFTVGKTDFQ
ncbi:hypothetical protein ASF84_17780 [Pseudomonas sp. Leaf127]|nr:hypothetical protein ASF84_17780 [Pseudomonas sp. Leaf127]